MGKKALPFRRAIKTETRLGRLSLLCKRSLAYWPLHGKTQSSLQRQSFGPCRESGLCIAMLPPAIPSQGVFSQEKQSSTLVHLLIPRTPPNTFTSKRGLSRWTTGFPSPHLADTYIDTTRQQIRLRLGLLVKTVSQLVPSSTRGTSTTRQKATTVGRPKDIIGVTQIPTKAAANSDSAVRACRPLALRTMSQGPKRITVMRAGTKG